MLERQRDYVFGGSALGVIIDQPRAHVLDPAASRTADTSAGWSGGIVCRPRPDALRTRTCRLRSPRVARRSHDRRSSASRRSPIAYWRVTTYSIWWQPVLVDAENVPAGQLWPTHARRGAHGDGDAGLGAATGHDVQVVGRLGVRRRPDRPSRQELEPPVWVVTSDRGCATACVIDQCGRRRRLVAWNPRKARSASARSRHLVRGSYAAQTLPIHTVWPGRSSPSFRSCCVGAGAAALAPATAVGRVDRDRPAASAGGFKSRRRSRTRACDRRGPPRSRSSSAESAVQAPCFARGLTDTLPGRSGHSASWPRRHGRWLAVTDAAVGNMPHRVGRREVGRRCATRAPLELVVDLSARTLTVRRNGSAVRHLSIGVGRAGSPTPTGTFAVRTSSRGAPTALPYGCCILSLSATQPNLPVGWTRAGIRIAIHGTLSASDFGRAVSAGCVHAVTPTCAT